MRSLSLVVLALSAWASIGPGESQACNRCRRPVCCCCASSGQRDQGRGSFEGSRGGAPVVAPVVMSTPMFAMPMMYASTPVMPTMATFPAQQQQQGRGNEEGGRGAGDCCDRVDRLAAEVDRLSQSVSNLQLIVDRQLQIMERLAPQAAPAAADNGAAQCAPTQAPPPTKVVPK